MIGHGHVKAGEWPKATTPAVPLYIAGAMMICGGLLGLSLLYEPRGRSSI